MLYYSDQYCCVVLRSTWADHFSFHWKHCWWWTNFILALSYW